VLCREGAGEKHDSRSAPAGGLDVSKTEKVVQNDGLLDAHILVKQILISSEPIFFKRKLDC
jgi:hypothetical protein